MKKIPSILIIGIIVAVIIGLYAGFVFFQKDEAENALAVSDRELEEKNEELIAYQNRKVEEAINAKETLTVIKADIIEWSSIISAILNTLPKEDKTPIVDVVSYSSGQSKAISLSAKTISDREEPYFDVAKMIEVFDDSPFFVENFVPSISEGTDDSGNEILTFSLSTQFIGDEKEYTEDINIDDDYFEETVVPRAPIAQPEADSAEDTAENAEEGGDITE